MGLRNWLKNKSKSDPQCTTCGKRGYSIDGRVYGCNECKCVWDAQAKFEQDLVLIKEKNTIMRDLE